MAQAKRAEKSGATSISTIWQGVHCARCRWPAMLTCCDVATNDWRPSCVNRACRHHGVPREWQAAPNWVARDA